MKTKLTKRIFVLLIVSFVVLFLARFIYELLTYSRSSGTPSVTNNAVTDSISYEGFRSTQNVASAKQTITDTAGSVEVSYDQKYEMVSNITAYSEEFEADEGELRATIKDQSGVIQMEISSGLPGSRSLWMSVGIPPSRFDTLVAEIREIGSITSFSVNKTDMTAEFRSLQVRSESLEKSRDAYNTLKEKGGEISDMMALEERIIELEQEIMQTSVTLGIYDESQSMCTIDFTLRERMNLVGTGITFSQVLYSARDAIPWTIGVYLLLLVFIIGTGLAVMAISSMYLKIAGQTGKAAPAPAKSPKKEDKEEGLGEK